MNIEDTPEWAAYEKAKTKIISTSAYLNRWTNGGWIELGTTQGSLICQHAHAAIALDRCIEALDRKRAELKP